MDQEQPMNDPARRKLAMLASLAMLLATAGAAQTAQQPGTLTIAGQAEQAPLVRINGKSYVDIESLARILHGSVRFQGSQTILTLPGAANPSSPSTAAAKPPQLSGTYLSAEIEALTQIREWRAALVNAIQNNYPITDAWVSRLRRAADSKQQLAIAATSTEPDQQAAALLRNEFTAMQQMSDQFLALQAKDSYIPPDSLNNNAQDQKILACQQALVAMAATKQFQDEISCH
jgi:hypothetical protein